MSPMRAGGAGRRRVALRAVLLESPAVSSPIETEAPDRSRMPGPPIRH